MKIRSVRYLAKEGCKNVWINRLMTVASVGVLTACMVLIGLAILISLNVKKAVGEIEKQNVVMVYFNDKNSLLYGNAEPILEDGEKFNKSDIKDSNYLVHNEEEAKAVCDSISNIDNVASVEYVTKEQALEDIKSSTPDLDNFDFLKEEGGNPLPDGARVQLVSMEKFSTTIQSIKATKGVYSIESQDDLADKINAFKDGIGIAGVWIIAILLIISLVIVSNTIRVTMYNRKLQISIMKAVGATDAFIRIPFLVEGVLIGIISAVFAECIVYFCYRVATEKIISVLNSSGIISFNSVALQLLAVFAAIGVFAGLFGSIIMISKYLRREGSEFTAI
ncbi:MAG: ABC transporter permease [Clostridiales bacterium]|nr:ABC transporter permease [Candidatus Equinaster intestinalis]